MKRRILKHIAGAGAAATLMASPAAAGDSSQQTPKSDETADIASGIMISLPPEEELTPVQRALRQMNSDDWQRERHEQFLSPDYQRFALEREQNTFNGIDLDCPVRIGEMCFDGDTLSYSRKF